MKVPPRSVWRAPSRSRATGPPYAGAVTASRFGSAVVLAAVLAAGTGCGTAASHVRRAALAASPVAASPPSSSTPASTPTVSPRATTTLARRAPATAPARLPLQGKVIALDPGHNGGNAADPAYINRQVDVITERKACDTTGTQTDAGYPEHAFTFDVAVRLAALLRAQGATVVFSRSNDTGVGPCITERAAFGNRAHAAAALSIHADGGPAGGYGFHVIEPLPVGPNDGIVAPSARLGTALRDAMMAVEPTSTYLGSHGIDRRSDLGGLNLSTVPKVFVECANMRNAVDAGRITSPAWRQQVAAALAAGLTRYLTGG